MKAAQLACEFRAAETGATKVILKLLFDNSKFSPTPLDSVSETLAERHGKAVFLKYLSEY